jgi:thiamine biosynthesis lipoprotein
MKKKWLLPIALAIAAALAALFIAPGPRTASGFVMGSMLQQTVWTAKWAVKPREPVAEHMQRLEKELNSAAEAPELALEMMEASNGAFSPYLGALVKLWNIDNEDGSPPYVPTQEEITEALRKRELDLGAYGKGAACDAALKNKAGQAAVIDLGGNILTYGRKPWSRPFKIALRSPLRPSETMGLFTFKGTFFISTSGSYDKYFEQNGRRYPHIFDPETGYPACREPGLVSVTVITGEQENAGALGDMLSTACFVLGHAEAQPLLRRYGAGALYIYEDGGGFAAGGARDYFEIEHPAYHWRGA